MALSASRLAGGPRRVVVSVRDVTSETARRLTGPARHLLPAMVRWSYPRASRVVAVSHGVADDLQRIYRFPPSLVRTIHNPLDYDHVTARSQEPCDHPWLAPDAPPVILEVGRLVTQKSFDLLLRAFAALRERQPAQLVILGEGPARPALAALAAELGIERDVALPGLVENPYAYMARSRVFCLSSQ